MRAFHGTTREAARQILKKGFKLSIVEDEVPNDLGDGVYFFIESRFRRDPKWLASIYAQTYKHGKTVLEVEVDDKIKVVDMDSIDMMIAVDNFRIDNVEVIEIKLAKFSTRHGIRTRGNVDGVIINMLVKRLEKQRMPIDGVIKTTFTKGTIKKEKISNFPNGRELCLHNLGKIENMKLDE